MIKKMIGIIVAVAVIVVIVVAALHHDKYTSMISGEQTEQQADPADVTSMAPAVEVPETPEAVSGAKADTTVQYRADSLGD